jgi:TolB-like protein/Tfp pilus assembly protein PilF
MSRLKERKIVQWTLAYLAAAWLVIQVLDAVGEPWSFSPTLQRVIQLLLGIGFLFAVVIAWYHGEQGRQRVTGAEVLIIAALCVVAGALLRLARDDSRLSEPGENAEATASVRRDRPAIAVLPFANIGDPEHAYFAEGIHDEIITRLSKISSITVIARTSTLKYAQDDRLSARAIAAELSVDYIIEGSVRRAADSVRVNAQLIDGHTDGHIWTAVYDVELGLSHIIGIQENIANQVAKAISAQILPDESSRLAAYPTDSDEAYDAYLRGRYFWNQRTEAGFQRAMQYFDEAIRLDSSFALAYAGLADAHNTLGAFFAMPSRQAFSMGRGLASRALELDSMLAPAHASLGYARLNGEWDWAGAEASLLEAIRINDSYAVAHQWYGQLLVYAGRTSEGIVELTRATDLDPLSLPIRGALGYGLYLARQFEASSEQLLRVQELDPDYPIGHLFHALPLLQLSRHAEAIAEIDRAIAIAGPQPPFLALRGVAYGLAGRADDALAVLEDLRTLARQQYVPPEQIATVCIHAGRIEEAFDWLDQALRERSYGLIYLRSDPVYDPLRSDQRFESIVRQVMSGI